MLEIAARLTRDVGPRQIRPDFVWHIKGWDPPIGRIQRRPQIASAVEDLPCCFSRPRFRVAFLAMYLPPRVMNVYDRCPVRRNQ